MQVSGGREWLSERALLAGWALTRTLPAPVVALAFRSAGDLAVRRGGAGVRQLRANLARVLAASASPRALDEVLRLGVRSYARYWRETFRLPVMDPAAIVAGTEVTGWEHVEAVRAQGRGIVAALSHSGNWDAYGVVYRHRLGTGFTTVAERLRPPAVFDRFVAHRERLGMQVLPLTGGAQPVATVLGEQLRSGGYVCLLADRDLSTQGLPIDFFGEPATFPPGPALLAATTGAALVPMLGSFTARGWRMEFQPEITIPAGGRLRDRVAKATGELVAGFERGIAAHPEDWHMLQPLWTADRVAEPRQRAGRPG